MGTHQPSEALLRALPGVEVAQQARVAECCGFGGTFSARHPAIPGAMVNDKLDSLRDSSAEVVVSADCGCLLNLHHAAEKRRLAASGCRAACTWTASCASDWAPPTRRSRSLTEPIGSSTP